MKIKVSEATNIQLDWMVAKCKGWVDKLGSVEVQVMMACDDFNYSTNWSQGGPIIDREEISLAAPTPINPHWTGLTWRSELNKQDGPTPLIAAMRCYVASIFGEEVEIPKKLK